MDSTGHVTELQIPDKLYGRAQALEVLTNTFDEVSQGNGIVLLVPGNSGVGKTSLVEGIRGTVKARNGLFLEGKFTQYQRSVPYSAVREALAGLCQELAGDNEKARRQWAERLRQAVGNLGQLLIDLIPEFESFLGSQPMVLDISPFEARHRFVGVLRGFLKEFCRPEHPVVLFLDDWQWADAASLELLTMLHIGSELRYLLVVASYRDEEVDPSHPLSQTVGELKRRDVPVNMLPVASLTEAEICAILHDTLRPEAENVEQLAGVLHRRTAGNPFFTRTLITSLHAHGLLRFDTTRAIWRWDSKNVVAGLLPADVLKLFTGIVGCLEPESRELLSLAASLGNQFELTTLAMISDRSLEECRHLLEPSLARNLILPKNGDRLTNEYRFMHDRVQQAAYDLVPAESWPQRRLRIGTLLWSRLSEAELQDRLFLVADHVNAGLALIDNVHDQVATVRLNVRAARKARMAIAYRAALQFHRAAAKLLERPEFVDHLWAEHHTLAHQFFLDRAETEFLEGDQTLAEECIEEAVVHAANAIEKAEALGALIVQFTLLARYPEAINAGREALAALGISLPQADYETARDAEIADVRASLRDRSVSDLAALPVMTHPEMCMAVKLLITMGPPCYRSHQRLWSVMVPKVVNLTIRYGNLPQVGYSYTAFGGLIGWVANDYSLTREFGELATHLMTETFDSPSDLSVFHLMIGSSVRHWCKPLSVSSRDYEQAYETGLASGNLQYAAYAFGHNMYCRFYQGTPLTELIRETEQSLTFSRTRLNQWAIDLLEGGLKVFHTLAGNEEEPEAYAEWESDYLRQVAEHQNIQVECIYKVHRALVLLMLGQCDRAIALSDAADSLIFTVGTQGLLPWPEHAFIRFMILVRLIPDAQPAEQKAWRAEIDRLGEQLRIWAEAYPENFGYKSTLAAAEAAILDGRQDKALRLYCSAAESAANADFVQWEGMAHERAALLLESWGQVRLAQGHWEEAYRCYEQWGATAKVRALEGVYRDCLQLDSLGRPTGGGHTDQQFRQELWHDHRQQLRKKSTTAQATRLDKENRDRVLEYSNALDQLRLEVARRKQADETLQRAQDELRSALNEAQRLNRLMQGRESQIVALKQRVNALDAECGRAVSFTEVVTGAPPALAKSGAPAPLNIAALIDVSLWQSVLSAFCDVMGISSAIIDVQGKVIVGARWQKICTDFHRVCAESQRYCVESDTSLARELAAREGFAIYTCKNGLTDAAAPIITNGQHVANAFVGQFLTAEPDRRFFADQARRYGYDEDAYFAALARVPVLSQEEIEVALQFLRGFADLLVTLAVDSDCRTRSEDELRQQRLSLLSLAEDAIRAERRATTQANQLGIANVELAAAKMALEEAVADLKRSNAELEQFAYVASHDLKEPLRMIRSYASLLGEEYAGRLDEEADKYIRYVTDGAARMQGLIDDLLCFSRIGRSEGSSAKADLGRVVDQVIENLETSIQESDVRMEVGAMPTVIGHESLLVQLLQNLIGNAIKFAGEVDPVVEVSCRAQDDFWEIAVEDNGIGIEPEYHERIFRVFQRLHGREEYPGSGIGLAICKKIVEYHGGRIWVGSKPGEGSRFCFNLPKTPVSLPKTQETSK